MSRLHKASAPLAQLAAHFNAEIAPGTYVPAKTIESHPGLVVNEVGGRRVLRNLVWGFPRRTREMRLRGDPPEHLGLVADITTPMWEQVAVDPRYRCLIVLTHFANPDGERGAKTRTWFAIYDQPIMAWAGFCRNTPEFGPVYARLAMEANAAIPPTNDRMPVLLEPAEYGTWLRGSIEDVIGCQFRPPMEEGRMAIEATDEPWRGGNKLAPSVTVQTSLF